jgi:hypothetical protein
MLNLLVADRADLDAADFSVLNFLNGIFKILRDKNLALPSVVSDTSLRVFGGTPPGCR